VVASSKAVVEDVAEPNMPNAAVKVAVLISKEIQCSADVKAIGLYRATFICFENSGCCIVSEMLFYNVLAMFCTGSWCRASWGVFRLHSVVCSY